MFRKEREFNIISGQRTNFISQRSLSCAQKRDAFKNLPQEPLKTTKLGVAKDRKMYQYDYSNDAEPHGGRSLTQQDSKSHLLPSMVNYISTDYNIITHKQQLLTSKLVSHETFNQRVMQANRKNPLTKILHAGRLVAPNYHEDYQERENRGEFLRRKNLCEEICNVEKGYSMGKYFRKLK